MSPAYASRRTCTSTTRLERWGWALGFFGSTATLKHYADLNGPWGMAVLGLMVVGGLVKMVARSDPQGTDARQVVLLTGGGIVSFIGALVFVPGPGHQIPFWATVILLAMPVVLMMTSLVGMALGFSAFRVALYRKERPTGGWHFPGRMMMNFCLVLAGLGVVCRSFGHESPTIVRATGNAFEAWRGLFASSSVMEVRPALRATVSPASLDPAAQARASQLRDLARQALTDGDRTKASHLAREAWSIWPLDVVDLKEVIETIASAESPDQALLFVRSLDEPWNGSSMARVLEAELLARKGDWMSAARLYEELFSRNLGTPEDIERYASLMLEHGREAMLLKTLEDCRVWRPSPRLRRLEATVLARRGQYDRALRLLPFPDAATATAADLWLWGECANLAGRPQLALRAVERLMDSRFDNERTQLIAGQAYTAMGRADEARRAFNKAAAFQARQRDVQPPAAEEDQISAFNF